jgi:hypothetical protein
MKTDTPRTDAKLHRANYSNTMPYVCAEFARELERENAGLREAGLSIIAQDRPPESPQKSMTPSELKAYDAMMEERDIWKSLYFTMCKLSSNATEIAERREYENAKLRSEGLAIIARCELEPDDPQCLGCFEVLEKLIDLFSSVRDHQQPEEKP